MALAALIFVFWGHPTAAVTIVIAVLLLVVLGLIELIGRPPTATSARTARPRWVTRGLAARFLLDAPGVPVILTGRSGGQPRSRSSGGPGRWRAFGGFALGSAEMVPGAIVLPAARATSA